MPDDLIPEDDAALLESAFERLKAEYDSDQSTEEGDDEESSDESTEGGEEEESSDDEDIDLGEVKLSKSDILELVRLREFLDGGTQDSLKSSAEALRRAAAVPSAPAAPATYTPPTPPEGLDLDDPGIKALWDNQVQMAQMLESQRQEILRRQAVETTNDVERSVSDWNNKYKLDDATLANLRTKAAETGIAPTMQSQGKSVYEGVHAALEGAFWSDPTLRNQYLLAAAEDSKKTSAADKSKQRKLSALSGRGSSTSHPKPVAEMTADERKTAMIAELTDHLSRT